MIACPDFAVYVKGRDCAGKLAASFFRLTIITSEPNWKIIFFIFQTSRLFAYFEIIVSTSRNTKSIELTRKSLSCWFIRPKFPQRLEIHVQSHIVCLPHWFEQKLIESQTLFGAVSRGWNERLWVRDDSRSWKSVKTGCELLSNRKQKSKQRCLRPWTGWMASERNSCRRLELAGIAIWLEQ